MQLSRNANRIFASVFLVSGLTVQVIAYRWMPDTPWSLVSGMLGICSVVLCSVGNIFTFLFGFAQIATYTYICYLNHLYGNIGINVFYFLSQIYGIYLWRKRGAGVTEQVETRRLPLKVWILLLAGLAVASLVTGYLLDRYTDDPQPYLDAFTTVPAILAQILLVLAYSEQWFLWFAIDIVYVVLWAHAGNGCMLMQYIFWCVNCVYGYLSWTQQRKAA